jgi:hypothetical protein
MYQLARTGLAVAAIGALGAAFAAGVSYGSAHPVTSRADRPAPLESRDIRFVNADLRPAQSCEDLLEWYVDHGVDRVTPYGWSYPYYRTAMADNAAGAPEPTAATSSETGTNVQEAGVDEPDVVKTDGALLVRVEGVGTLVVYDVTGDEPVRLGSLPLEGMFQPELLLAGDRVVVIGRDPGAAKGKTDPGSTVLVVDVADPSSPTVVHEASYDSSVVTARQHGDVVRLVVSVGLPALDFVEPGLFRRDQTALEKNQQIVRESTIDDWLPHMTTIGADGPVRDQLVDCEDVAIPAHDAGLGTIAVAGFDVDDPESVTTTAVTTPSETVYVSADHLYLASSPYRLGWSACCWDVIQPGWGQTADSAWDDTSGEGTTYLYGFDLEGTAAAYAASGEVDGWIADRWAMDEHDGSLRVAVGPTMQTGNFNSIVTFSRQGSDLVEAGRVDKLGVGEDIKAVRWFDDLAVIVTFRQTDPFYAVDLSDPDDPVLLDELKIPGFSSYLHPIGDDQILGIGYSASAATGAVHGAKASLFDVSDLTFLRELDTVEYPEGTMPQAATDPRQFTWLADRRTALTVISDGWEGKAGYVSVLRVGDTTVSSELVEVEYGADIAAVRLVPLPDGRVVLTTGDEVSFFDV